MPSWADVREIAAMLPGSEERVTTGGAALFVRSKLFAWECHPWPSIPEPVRTIVATEEIVGVKVGDAVEVKALREMDPRVFLPQTTGWSEPKIAFRIAEIDAAHLRELIEEGWRVQAPRYLVREFDGS